MKTLLLLGSLLLSSVVLADDGRTDIWPSIPFIRGADLCKYRDAYGSTRSEYMQDMVRNASDLMQSGALGNEALDMLVAFNGLYDRNQALATRGYGLSVSLEATLKGFVDSYHRKLRPKKKKLSFTHTNDLVSIIRSASNGQRPGISDDMINKLDYIAYGTYTLAPNCRGKIQVTIHLVGRDGRSESFVATGKPETVMSQIASELYTLFQRTQFPSKVRVGNRTLTLVGGLNGSVDETSSPDMAAQACRTLDARLPNRMEIELIDTYGDWSGGVGLGDAVWAMPYGKVYHPGLMNPSPVRNTWEVNAKRFKYYCVR